MVFLQLFLVLIPICSSSTSISTSTNTSAVAEDIGILVIGGWSSSQSIEFWSNPEEGSCQLNDYPRAMKYGPTANLVSGQLVACSEDSCEIYNGGGEWNHLADTSSKRWYHTSAVKEDDDRILLIGGYYSNSTEWISVDGSPSQPGPFHVRHGPRHCTIQVSSDLVLVTGGGAGAGAGAPEETYHWVTRYHLSGNGDETPLTPMKQGRYDHACGVYQDADGQQVLLVTGGITGGMPTLNTEVAVYSGGSQLEWREVEGGQLPSPRFGLRASVVNKILFVTGGLADGVDYVTSILSWDPVAESWQPVGDLAVGRLVHAAVAVPASVIGAC